ncbi:uncharacterized protein LOC106163933 [Lingula anatina]|uniref:Uncharacterized protein LOC106163933 n=1 Tax=Lingula anatina TaxID=7574 RepID=A0A1S3IFW4_LINAN|nr:uncharacterized protein LOC106163933 [Lingula anatina]|eukprot:XP_013397107.1 uncharacterized protein LOC106163933 [Lingula anatina]
MNKLYPCDCQTISDFAGFDYNGRLSFTSGGYTCQRWDTQVPNNHTFTNPATYPDATVSDAENYCRNPDPNNFGIWCYVVEPNVTGGVDLCDVPPCPDSYSEEACTATTTAEPETTTATTTTTGYIWSHSCRRSGLGKDYIGTQNTTDSNQTCLSWVDYGASFGLSDSDFIYDGSMASAENYCRNPDSHSGGLWCPVSNTTRGVCAIPLCDPCDCQTFSDFAGFDYNGRLNFTTGGYTCQRWDSQFPNNHTFTDAGTYPDTNVSDAENFCRNPDPDNFGIWCYVIEPEAPGGVDLCDVPPCPATYSEAACTATTTEEPTTTTGMITTTDTLTTTDTITTTGAPLVGSGYIWSDWCRRTKIGIDYIGFQNVSLLGNSCLPWAEHGANFGLSDASFIYDGSMANASNYCRNPNSQNGGPWCPVTNTTFERCYIPRCDLCDCQTANDFAGFEYNGRLNFTISGYTCQRWDSQFPNNHTFTDPSMFPDANVSDAENYCRNPDTDNFGIWCYVVEPEAPGGVDLCDVPPCGIGYAQHCVDTSTSTLESTASSEVSSSVSMYVSETSSSTNAPISTTATADSSISSSVSSYPSGLSESSLSSYLSDESTATSTSSDSQSDSGLYPSQSSEDSTTTSASSDSQSDTGVYPSQSSEGSTTTSASSDSQSDTGVYPSQSSEESTTTSASSGQSESTQMDSTTTEISSTVSVQITTEISPSASQYSESATAETSAVLTASQTETSMTSLYFSAYSPTEAFTSSTASSWFASTSVANSTNSVSTESSNSIATASIETTTAPTTTVTTPYPAHTVEELDTLINNTLSNITSDVLHAVQTITNLINVHAANATNNVDLDTRREQRGKVVTVVVNLANSSVTPTTSDLLGLANVLADVTQVSNELSNDTMLTCVEAAFLIIDKTKSSNATLEEVVFASTALTSTTSNIFNVAVSGNEVVVEAEVVPLSDQEKTVVRGLATETTAFFDAASWAIYNRLDNSTNTTVTISTPFVNMTIQKMAHQTNETVQVFGANISLPTIDSADGDLRLKILSFKHNIYAYGNESSKVNTAMTSIDLSYPNGTKYVLKEPIRASVTTSIGDKITYKDLEHYRFLNCDPVYHNFTIPDPTAALRIEFGVPEEVDFYELSGFPNEAPTETNYTFKYLISHSGVESADLVWNVKETVRVNSDVVSLFIPAGEILETGFVIVKIVSINATVNSTSHSRVKRLAGAGRGRVAAESTTMETRVWDTRSETWSTNSSIEILEESTKDNVVFKSNFLGSFCTGVFIPPNSLDFAGVVANFSERLAENPYVLIILCILLAIYFLLLIWARWADKKDQVQWEYAPLVDNEADGMYLYRISVHTGLRRGAGTSANVFIQLTGTGGKTGPRVLIDGFRKNFTQGSVSNFLLTTREFLGDITRIHVWHDGNGYTPDWYLSKITVVDILQQTQYYFNCGQWLSLTSNTTCIEIDVTAEQNMKNFSVLFNSHSKVGFFDDHTWFSLFKRPSKSNFSRVQRLSVCLSILFMTMMVSCMWYRDEADDTSAARNSSIEIGPLKITFEQIFVGLMGSLIVVPPTALIVHIFKRSRKRVKGYSEDSKDRLEKLLTKVKLYQENNVFKEEGIVSAENGKSLEQVESDQEKQRLTSPTPKSSRCCKGKRFTYPWWFIIFGYILVFLTTFAGGFITLFYGLQWGSVKFLAWFGSWVLSFVDSLLLVQPVKAVLLAVILSCIMRMPDEEEDCTTVEEDFAVTISRGTISEYSIPKGIEIPLEPPDINEWSEGLEERKKTAQLDDKLFTFLKDNCLHLLYLALLIWIASANRDSKFYYQNKAIQNSLGLSSVSKVRNHTMILPWIEKSILPPLFPRTTYNGDLLSSDAASFMLDIDAYRLGPVRIRQLRVTSKSCLQVRVAYLRDPYGCFSDYSDSNAEHGTYLPGWEGGPAENVSSSPFAYSSPHSNTLFTKGVFASYGGGGYLEEFQYFSNADILKFAALKDNNWTDSRTRAVLIEFTVNNEISDIFTATKILVETPAVGSAFVSSTLTSFRPYPYKEAIDLVLLLAQIVWLGLVLYLLVKHIIGLKKQGWQYFYDAWNVFDLVKILLAVMTIIVYVVRIVYIMQAVEHVFNNRGQFTSFDKVAEVDEIFSVSIAVLCFFAIMELYRPLSFSQTLAIIKTSLKISLSEMVWYAVAFIIIYLAFVSSLHVDAGNLFFAFRSLYASFSSLFLLTLGLITYDDVFQEKELLSTVLYIVFNIFVYLIVLNLFIAVICDSQVAAKEESDQGYDEELSIHFWKRVQGLFDSLGGSKKEEENEVKYIGKVQVTSEVKENATDKSETDEKGEVNGKMKRLSVLLEYLQVPKEKEETKSKRRQKKSNYNAVAISMKNTDKKSELLEIKSQKISEKLQHFLKTAKLEDVEYKNIIINLEAITRNNPRRQSSGSISPKHRPSSEILERKMSSTSYINNDVIRRPSSVIIESEGSEHRKSISFAPDIHEISEEEPPTTPNMWAKPVHGSSQLQSREKRTASKKPPKSSGPGMVSNVTTMVRARRLSRELAHNKKQSQSAATSRNPKHVSTVDKLNEMPLFEELELLENLEDDDYMYV